ncbi:FAD-dependent oxidoreductase [Thermosulfuriphilus ammonigenes]|uniref:FAD-dependent oxidoreductase n=1 Tax=Thermosulfuriphilus ammonigenes TaxID=1936021 RepID=A0A6G7PTS7_9BACT|nr:formate dehydrogenase major subunit [Thermosulfuriphilus ammonigenes]QIJ71052.1 FAD-dependent oxidoreductase [Thermosulfuriphilus ammonigenes]
MITLQIDGKRVEVSEGMTILQAARQAGITIPTLCHLEGKRSSDRPCGLCLVEVEGQPSPLRACATPVEEGMVVTTASEELLKHRRERLEAMAAYHYGDCKAPCSQACPGGINVQGYVNLIAQGQYAAALRLIKERNPLPLSVGRVCPRFCEPRCRRVLVDEPIAINHLKRFLADWAMQHGEPPEEVAPPTGHRVAIIGGGPAGLSAAYYLAKAGHQAVIFEAMDELGGMLRYGIPEYKLPKKVLDREIQNILSLGVEVHTGKRWGKDFSLKSLKEEGYKAIFIATGAWKEKPLEVPGSEHLLGGLSFLRQINQGLRPEIRQPVVIFGGGDVAIECARAARRLGAEEVTVIYPRSRMEMPAHQRDIREAEKEGVRFFLMATPMRVEPTGNGLFSVELARTVLGEPDKKGVRHPVPVPGSRVIMEAGTVISAQGQMPDTSFLTFDELEAKLAVSPKGTVKANPSTMKTNLEGIFAGGDLVSGPRTVIQAVAAGRRAAEAIDAYLRGVKVKSSSTVRYNFTKGRRFEDVDLRNYQEYTIKLQERMPERSPEVRVGDFEEVELGFNEAMARREASRCLSCGCLGLSKCSFRDQIIEHQAKVSHAPTRLRVPVDSSHPFIIVDANKCIACTRCERACPYGALELSINDGQVPEISIRLKDNCLSCGACVDACPTGALTKKTVVLPASSSEMTKVPGVCTFCGTGCNLEIHTKCGTIVEIKANENLPPNFANLCVKGRFGYTFYRHKDRLTKPLIRTSIDSPFREVSWEEAIEFAAFSLKEIRDSLGPQAIGVLASARCSNEENFLYQKFARAVIGTNSVDNCARV